MRVRVCMTEGRCVCVRDRGSLCECVGRDRGSGLVVTESEEVFRDRLSHATSADWVHEGGSLTRHIGCVWVHHHTVEHGPTAASTVHFVAVGLQRAYHLRHLHVCVCECV